MGARRPQVRGDLVFWAGPCVIEEGSFETFYWNAPLTLPGQVTDFEPAAERPTKLGLSVGRVPMGFGDDTPK